MSRLFLALLFLLFFNAGHSQDWKSHYNQAVADYQSQNYAQALVNSEKAYAASKDLDITNQAFTLQLLTAICIEQQDFAKGLVYAKDEVKLFGQIEGVKGTRYAEAISKRAKMYAATSAFSDALKDYEELLLIYAQVPGSNSAEYYKAQSNYGQILLSTGDFLKAGDVLSKAVIGLKQFPTEGEEYLLALFYSANAESKGNNMAGVQEKLREFISIADKNDLQSWPEYSQAKTQLLQIADTNGNRTEALALAEGASDSDQKARQYLKVAIESEPNKPEEANHYFQLAQGSLGQVGVTSNTAFSIFLNYARFLLNLGKLTEAQQKFEQAKQLAAKLFAQTSPEYGYMLELNGALQLTQGDIIGAEQNMSLALNSFSVLPIPIQATHRIDVAAKFLNANRPDIARRFLEKLTQDYPALLKLPEKSQVRLSILYSEALLQLNESTAAITHLIRHQSGSTQPSVQMAIAIKLGEAYKNVGEWGKSETILEEVIRRPSGVLPEIAEASYQLARLRQQMGKYKEAEVSYREAIAGYGKLQSRELKQVYNSFATFYTTLGNYSAAEKIFKDLLSDPQTATSLRLAVNENLASIYQQTHRYDEAERLFKEVLEIDRKTIGEKHPDFAVGLQNLAALYQVKGDFEQAKKLNLQALEVDRLNGAEQTLGFANKSANLGTVYQATGEPQKARIMFESALKVRERMLGRDHLDYIYNLYNIAVLDQEMGEYEHAAPRFKKVSEFYLKQIKEIFPTLSDYEKTAYFNKINRLINDYEDFVVRYQQNDGTELGALYDFRLQTKALLLNSSTKVRNTIIKSGNQQLLAKFTEWLQIKEKLANFATLTLEEKESMRKVSEERVQKANELEKWLSSQSELFAGEFGKQPATWQDVKAALKSGEAAIEVIRLSLEKDSIIYAALVLRPERPSPDLIIFPRGKAMERREFSYYSTSMRFMVDNVNSYDLYWRPFEPLLRGVTSVFFSADGVYNKINPLTLFDTQKKQFLIDQLTLRLLSNTRELLQAPSVISPNPSASLFGYPNFQSGESSVVHPKNDPKPANLITLRNGLEQLPGTKEEVLNIERLLKKDRWSVNSFLYDDAREDKIKGIRSPDVLHIATHGFFIPEQDVEAPIIYSRDLSLGSDNPLLRSGLLLAGSEKYLTGNASKAEDQEDGILTALEVMNLSLDQTNLVVLSACETGSGEIRNGEGVYGLQRAFLVSGARSLIMSLWKVSDEATQDLMTGFYSQLLISKDKIKAFREAQLALKKKYPEPNYWGAFIFIGQ